jgi:uncharacterized membrane protein
MLRRAIPSDHLSNARQRSRNSRSARFRGREQLGLLVHDKRRAGANSSRRERTRTAATAVRNRVNIHLICSNLYERVPRSLP